jgi:hypothetical protein
MENFKKSPTVIQIPKRKYIAPHIDKVQLDLEISMVMMSNPPIEGFPQQDPLMSQKMFRIFK